MVKKPSEYINKEIFSSYSLTKKILISLFIFFHWGCVIAWVLPKPSPIKSFLLNFRLPLPGYAVEGGVRTNWKVASRPLVANYLFHSAQWQDWSMFAPNPLQVNRYISVSLHRRDGSMLAMEIPRLSRMSVWGAWIQKRWRKYQQNLFETHPAYIEDFSRYMARVHENAANPVVRVSIWGHEAMIPRHDRPEIMVPSPPWINYTEVLRHQMAYSQRHLRDVTILAVP